MLQLNHIVKDYPAGGSVVHALRRGTAGCALGVAGLHAVTSELGRRDQIQFNMR